MSTQTALGFASPTVEKLPQIACVGTVSSVEEGKVSQKGTYVVQRVVVGGKGANKTSSVNLLYRPEWFTPGFNPDTIKELDNADSVMFVYTRNIVPPPGDANLSVLQGLAGSDERFAALSGKLLSLNAGTTEELISSIESTLRTFLVVEGKDTPIGYKLAQAKEDTGNVDEHGKKIKILKASYELDSFFYPTEKKLKSLRSYAQRKPENLK